MKFLCQTCGFEDTGNYCSSCGGRLPIEPQQAPRAFARYLLKVGFIELPTRNDFLASAASGTKMSIPEWFPYPVAQELLAAINEIPEIDPILLTVDRSNTRKVEIDVILDCDGPQMASVAVLAKALVRRLAPCARGVNRAAVVKLYLFFEPVADPAGHLYPLKSLRRKLLLQRYAKGTVMVSLSFVLVSLEERKFIPAFPSILDPDIAISLRSVIRQTRTSVSNPGKQGSEESGRNLLLETFLLKPTEEVRKLGLVMLQIVAKPMVFARQVEFGQITIGRALYYLTLPSLFVLAVQKIVRIEGPTIAAMELPLGEELVQFLFIVLVMVFFATLCHISMLIVGGKAAFSKTLIVIILITVVTIPGQMLIDAAYYLIDKEGFLRLPFSVGGDVTAILSTGYLLSMLRVVHKVPIWRVIFGFSIFLVFMLIVYRILSPYMGTPQE
jgi:hypothetical protein